MSTSTYWLSEAGLQELLDLWAREEELIAPVRSGDEVVFRHVQGAGGIARDYVNSLVPPKQHFLPGGEPLVSYTISDGKPSLKPANGAPSRLRILYGIRSCDVAGLGYLDTFFSGKLFGDTRTADLPYLRRRAATAIVSVVCQEAGETCMCVCCRGGPSLEEGFDWQLTRLASGYLVETRGTLGVALVRLAGPRLRPAEPPELREAAERKAAAVDCIAETSPNRVQTMASGRLLSTGRLDRTFWDEVGERCFECGGCAFVCPTCSCFNVADVRPMGSAPFEEEPVRETAECSTCNQDGAWDRIRMRDCCMLSGFVREAGGGYPKGTTGERCRTRFFHKMSWQFSARMGSPGCTGCGRCLEVCPADNGIARVSERMTQVLTGNRPHRTRTEPSRPEPAGAAERGA